MPTVVGSANLKTDERPIIDFLLQNHSANSNLARFRWLYQSNPDGVPRVSLMHDSETGALIGVAAAFPRRVYVEGSQQTAWVLGDFCVSSRQRSLGPVV